LKIIAIVAVIALSGCAAQQQVLNAAEASALVSIKAANDNAIRVWTAAACGTPLSAIIRNPQVIPALRVLCLPVGVEGGAGTLLK